MIFQRLNMYPSSGKVWGTPTLLDTLEGANLKSLKTNFNKTRAIYTPETSFFQREITEKYAIKMVIEHA
jgi:hypothetical protein